MSETMLGEVAVGSSTAERAAAGIVGFKRLSADRHKEISSMGGRKAHAMGTAHRFTPEQAREAALKAVAKRREKAAAENERSETNVKEGA